MKGTYYKTPIDFKALIEKHDLAKTTLESSIDQQLFLLTTTAWGECKFNEGFGTGFWEAHQRGLEIPNTDLNKLKMKCI